MRKTEANKTKHHSHNSKYKKHLNLAIKKK